MSSPLKAPKEIADAANAAEEDLQGLIQKHRLNQEKEPWIFPPPGRPLTQKVTETWFKVCMPNIKAQANKLISLKNPSNIKKVEELVGKKFRSPQKPELSLYASYPVAFTNTLSPITGSFPFPGRYLVIVALGDLHLGNGLPKNADAEALSSGEWVVIDGNESISFSGKGGGIAQLQILDLVEPEVGRE